MNPHDLIESYVDEVAFRLPRRLRNDVGLELRALLREELQAKADEAGRPPDEAMALALLTAFGRPADVADRYRPASFVIIRASETRAFATTAILGVVIQWALTLPAVFLQPEAFPGQNFSRLAGWWGSWGLGAFWWPGLMVVLTIIVRWIGHRWPQSDAWAPPEHVDRDRINRPLLTAGLVGWALAAGMWIVMPLYGPELPGVLPQVFAFDKGFLSTRGPWFIPVWAALYAIHVVALTQGRWGRTTRRISFGLGLAVCAVLAWFIIAGPIFVSRFTDHTAKGLLALTILLGLISETVTLRRELARVPGSGKLTNVLRAGAP